jgi:non-specific serine/threonine protein kinase
VADDELIGRTLGHYEILAPIGRGGMGRVYRARDIALERDVALKLVAEDHGRDPARQRMLRREARLLAALTHPNVATVYELSESGELAFLAMELVRGKTLAEILEAGPVPVQRALRWCRQIAAALEAAHAGRIVHRDLKPANVLVRDDDTVKVVDFGLGADRSGADVGDAVGSPTTLATGFLGTPGYASPEQLRGQALDERGDIFSFGVVLYECLSRSRAFAGRSGAERVAATLREAPDLDRLDPGTPQRVRALLGRCLAKRREERPPTMAVVLREIDAALADDGATATPSAPTALSPGAAPRPGRLPPRPRALVGRDADAADVERLLERSSLVTLTGAGGCGKTSLAIEVARRLRGHFQDGVRFVELATVAEPGLVDQALAAAVGLAEEREVPLHETLTRHLRDREMLLVLDDADYCLRPCADLVQELLRDGVDLRFLVTSRETLLVPEERVRKVDPLETPPPTVSDPEELLRIDSCRLFLERAQAASPGFRVTEANAAAVARICRHLDGIPLALELAAARVRVLGADEIAARLDDRFRLLTVGGRTALPHHRTLSALIEWSYDHLAADAQALLRALSVFAGGCTLEAAEDVAGPANGEDAGILDPLQDLVAKSLVERTEGAGSGTRGRYRMLESIREYARRRLEESGEAARVRRRHRRHFLAHAARIAEDLTGPDQIAGLAELEIEHANLDAALRTGLEEAPAEALRLAAVLGRYWLVRGRWAEGRALGGQLLAHPAVGAATPERATVLHWVGHLTFYQGDYDRAAALFDEALAIRRAVGAAEEIADSLTGRGFVSANRGQLADAAALFGESLEIARAQEDRHGVARALNNLGWVARQRGEYEHAQRHFEESLGIAHALGDDFGIAFVLTNLGHVLEWKGDLDAAGRRFAAAQELRERLGDRAGVAENLLNLGSLALAGGRDGEARSRLEEALTLYRDIGHRSGAAAALAALGRVAARAGVSEEARGHLEESLRTRRELGDRQGVADSLEAWASALLRQERPADSARLLGRAERIREEIGTPPSPREADEVAATWEEIRRALGRGGAEAVRGEGRDTRMEDGPIPPER